MPRVGPALSVGVALAVGLAGCESKPPVFEAPAEKAVVGSGELTVVVRGEYAVLKLDGKPLSSPVVPAALLTEGPHVLELFDGAGKSHGGRVFTVDRTPPEARFVRPGPVVAPRSVRDGRLPVVVHVTDASAIAELTVNGQALTPDKGSPLYRGEVSVQASGPITLKLLVSDRAGNTSKVDLEARRTPITWQLPGPREVGLLEVRDASDRSASLLILGGGAVLIDGAGNEIWSTEVAGITTLDGECLTGARAVLLEAATVGGTIIRRFSHVAADGSVTYAERPGESAVAVVRGTDSASLVWALGDVARVSTWATPFASPPTTDLPLPFVPHAALALADGGLLLHAGTRLARVDSAGVVVWQRDDGQAALELQGDALLNLGSISHFRHALDTGLPTDVTPPSLTLEAAKLSLGVSPEATVFIKDGLAYSGRTFVRFSPDAKPRQAGGDIVDGRLVGEATLLVVGGGDRPTEPVAVEIYDPTGAAQRIEFSNIAKVDLVRRTVDGLILHGPASDRPDGGYVLRIAP